MRKLILFILLGILLSSPVYAVDSAVVETENTEDGYGEVIEYIIRCVADESGNLTADAATRIWIKSGYIVKVQFISDTGDTQPTDDYDIDIQDEYTVDQLLGVGTDVAQSRTDTDSNIRTPINTDSMLNYVHEGFYFVTGSGLGADNAFYMKLYIKKTMVKRLYRGLK